MRRLTASLLCILFWLTSPASCRALSYIVRTTPGFINTPTSNGLFRNSFEPAPSFEYFSPSVISFASVTTFPESTPVPGTSDIFSGTTKSFTFRFGPGDGNGNYPDGSDFIEVAYLIYGEIGYGDTGTAFSTSRLLAYFALVHSGDNAGVTGKYAFNPLTGLPSLRLDLAYDDTPVSVWIDIITSIPAPGADPITVSGFVSNARGADVPEPGLFLNFLAGFGCWLLTRRKR